MMPLKSLWNQLEQVANEIDSDVLLELEERDHMDAEFASVSQSNFYTYVLILGLPGSRKCEKLDASQSNSDGNSLAKFS